MKNARLLDDFNGAFGTLHFASSANEAFVVFYNNRFFILNLKNLNRTGVDACSASSAFFNINFNFYHVTFNSIF